MSDLYLVATGNVGKDPEEYNNHDGSTRCHFSVAHNHPGKRDDGVTWVNVTVWRDSTIKFVMDHVHKGDVVTVRGQCKLREWETDDGEKRQSLDLNADHVEKAWERRGEDDGGERIASASKRALSEDDIPW